MTTQLPNVRKLFIPDPGMTMFDCDLSGADAQVVAWEAEDEILKDAFKKGLKVHILNCRTMFPHIVKGWSDEAIKENPIYSSNKRAVHATNYGGSAKTIAATNGWTVYEAENFQRKWFAEHPGIKLWHNRVEMEIRTKRRVNNAFGYSRTYFDRIDRLLPEALAWIPQSTVALVTFSAALRIRSARRARSFYGECLIQVHDSLVGQYPTALEGESLRIMKELLHVVIPYPDPLVIPWGLATSTKSWGHCEGRKWPESK